MKKHVIRKPFTLHQGHKTPIF